MANQFSTATTATSKLTSVASGTSSGALRSTYTTLIASTDRESYNITIQIRSETALREPYRIVIATGAASSETDILEFLFWSSAISAASGGDAGGQSFTIPLTVPSGVRVSANAATSWTAGAAVGVSICLNDNDSFGTSTENFLTDTTSGFKGIVIDPGGTANTKGSWAQLIASTPHDIDMMIVNIGPNDNGVQTNDRCLVDIGTGAAASEAVIIPNIGFCHNGFEFNASGYHTFYEEIPSGTRIAARAQSTITDATDRVLDVAVLGVRRVAPVGGGGGGSDSVVGY